MFVLGVGDCWACKIPAPSSSKYNELFATSVPNETPTAGSRKSERVAIGLSDGTAHSVVLSIPEKANRPLPVLMVLGGFDTGEKSVTLLKQDTEAIYATVDYPYKAPNERGFVKDLKQISSIKKAVHRTDLAVDAMIEKLQADPRVDPKKMVFVGASFGAPFAITAAVRNSSLNGLILIHAFGKVGSAIEQQLVNEWGSWSRPISWALGSLAWNYLDYPEPEVEAQKLHTHQKVFYVYSDADDQLPCGSVVAMHESLAKSPANITTAKNLGGHLGPGKKSMIDDLMRVSMIWLKDVGFM